MPTESLPAAKSLPTTMLERVSPDLVSTLVLEARRRRPRLFEAPAQRRAGELDANDAFDAGSPARSALAFGLLIDLHAIGIGQSVAELGHRLVVTRGRGLF